MEPLTTEEKSIAIIQKVYKEEYTRASVLQIAIAHYKNTLMRQGLNNAQAHDAAIDSIYRYLMGEEQ